MRKILYLWMICVVLCSLVSCNDSDDKTYSSYVSRFVWENRCNHRIEYFYVEGCITRSQGIKYGERAVKELEGYGHEIEMYTIEQGEKRDKRQ